VGTQVTYAGKVNEGNASIAIAVKDGKAVAYFCDGRTAEAWLQGTFAAGKLTLTGEKNSSLTATVANGTAAGSVTAAGKTFAFSVKNVAPPSGLYRAASNVNNAKLVGGWIVLPDGSQVGLATVGESTVVPGAIDTSTGTATVGSSTVTATKLDGSGL
jgi:serine/threonine-protein kinase